MKKILSRVTMTGIVLLLVIQTFGCSISGGMKHRVVPTLGQELIELKKARDKNAISENEYRELKEKLIESADRNCWEGSE